MSIATEIERLQNAKTSIKTAIENKGVEVGDGTIDTYASKIDEISVGVDLLQYATFVNGNMFRSAVFPDDLDVYFKIRGDSSSMLLAFSYLFFLSNIKNVTIEIVESIEKGVTFNSVFQSCTELLNVNFANNIFYIGNGASSFNGATKLEKINGVLDLSLANNTSGMFGKCNSLIKVRFNEKSIKKSLSFSDSPNLSSESITSIINGLADLTGQTAQTLTLHADVKSKLTETQIASITSKNWTLA